MRYIIAALAAGLVCAALITAVVEDARAPKASAFNQAIKDRNQGDERATYADKQTVKNILAAGCLPVISKDTNINIQSSCPLF